MWLLSFFKKQIVFYKINDFEDLLTNTKTFVFVIFIEYIKMKPNLLVCILKLTKII
jgi:hypothetical protein